MPALRERREDVELLSRTLLEGIASELGRGGLSLSPEAVRALERYPWPGNIRELRNVLERAALLCEGRVLGGRDLRFEAPSSAAPGPDTSLTLLEMERRHIERVLREEGGHVEARRPATRRPAQLALPEAQAAGAASGRRVQDLDGAVQRLESPPLPRRV